MNKLISTLFIIILISSCSKKKDATNNPPVVILPDTLSAGWAKITSLPNESFTDIVFADNNTGYATSNNGIYKSINSGVNWAKISAEPGMINMSVANPNRACFVNQGDRPFITQDGGTSFQSTQYITPGGPPGFRDCFFSGTNTCYLSSGIYIWKSTNGGVSFDTAYNFQNSSSESIMFFLNDQDRGYPQKWNSCLLQCSTLQKDWARWEYQENSRLDLPHLLIAKDSSTNL